MPDSEPIPDRKLSTVHLNMSSALEQYWPTTKSELADTAIAKEASASSIYWHMWDVGDSMVMMSCDAAKSALANTTAAMLKAS